MFASLAIIILAIGIQTLLQLSQGVFAVFYHHALGKTTAKKADDRSLSFILGVEIFTAVFYLLTYLIVSFVITQKGFDNIILVWIMIGIFITEAVFFFFCYYKMGKKYKKTSRLFVNRHVAEALIYKAEHAKSRTDTIILGIVTSAIELAFTLPLFVISSVEILRFDSRFGFLFIVIYVIAATAPLFGTRILFRANNTLAGIMQIRSSKKNLYRILITIGYLSIAALVFITGVVK